ncbi:MAG: tetratricopeptide repeat protein [bacterium]|nr:tetratricopeptide repeat protein [bacterium]
MNDFGPSENDASEAPARAADRSALVAIPPPAVSAADERAARHLERARARFEAASAAAGADDRALAASYGELGMVYHAYADLPPAEACYRNAALLDPAEFRWPYYLGQLYRATGQRDESIARFEKTLELNPHDSATLVHLGSLYFDQNRFTEAQALFERALVLGERAAASFGLGRILAAEGNPAEAVQYLTAALRAAPQATRIHYLLGMAYRDLGETERATAHLEQAGMVKPQPADPLMTAVEGLSRGTRPQKTRAAVAFQERKYAIAARELQTAAARTPEDPAVHLNLGTVLASRGQLDQAEQEFQTSLRLADDERLILTAHLNLGNLRLLRGLHADAIEHYRTVLDLDPECHEAHLNLGAALVGLNRFEAALERYRKLAAVAPREAGARVGQVTALKGLRRYAEARRVLEQSDVELAGEATVVRALAELLATCPDAAVRDGQRAVALAERLFAASKSPDHAVTLALALAEQGEYDAAIRLQRAAVAAAEQIGRSDLATSWRRHLERYEEGQPVRLP